MTLISELIDNKVVEQITDKLIEIGGQVAIINTRAEKHLEVLRSTAYAFPQLDVGIRAISGAEYQAAAKRLCPDYTDKNYGYRAIDMLAEQGLAFRETFYHQPVPSGKLHVIFVDMTKPYRVRNEGRACGKVERRIYQTGYAPLPVVTPMPKPAPDEPVKQEPEITLTQRDELTRLRLRLEEKGLWEDIRYVEEHYKNIVDILTKPLFSLLAQEEE